MLKELKAIETHYKGYRFRSRLEARWAVFFDAMGFSWEYEPEGFHTAAGRYLPDFTVLTPQGQKCWYEVKPGTVLEDEKAQAFADASRDRVAILSGDPITHLQRPGVGVCPRCGFISEAAYGPCDAGDETGWGCEPCDFETPCGGDAPSEIGIHNLATRPHKGFVMTRHYLPMYEATFKAAIRARSARFEHGERG